MAISSKLSKSAIGNSLGLLTNKWVLYFMLILGVFDIFNFYQNGQMMSLYVFLFVGVLTSFFSKNMIVIIVTAITVAHIFTFGNRMSEGFEEKAEEDEEELEDESEEDKQKKPEEKVEVPSADAIKGAATDLASEIKKTGVDGLSKETFELIKAQETLLDNLGKLSNFVKVEGMSKKEGYCSLEDAYK